VLVFDEINNAIDGIIQGAVLNAKRNTAEMKLYLFSPTGLPPVITATRFTWWEGSKIADNGIYE